jgi:hypothetical protein
MALCEPPDSLDYDCRNERGNDIIEQNIIRGKFKKAMPGNADLAARDERLNRSQGFAHPPTSVILAARLGSLRAP